jgi:hypothetical protein
VGKAVAALAVIAGISPAFNALALEAMSPVIGLMRLNSMADSPVIAGADIKLDCYAQ